MYISLPVLAAIAVAVVAALLFASRRRGAARDLIAPPPYAPPYAPPVRPPAIPGAALPPEIEAEARALMAARRKIEAIKIVRAATGLALAEAKDLVERL